LQLSERGCNILLHANEELLIVAFACRCIAENCRKACLNHRLKTIKHTLGSGLGSTKEGVDGILNAFAGLGYIARLANEYI
jgi:hypothetical protein